MKKTREELEADLSALKEELAELNKALPAHTVRPHQIMALETVEDKIKEIEGKLKELGG
jgi:ribosomal protein L29